MLRCATLSQACTRIYTCTRPLAPTHSHTCTCMRVYTCTHIYTCTTHSCAPAQAAPAAGSCRVSNLGARAPGTTLRRSFSAPPAPAIRKSSLHLPPRFQPLSVEPETFQPCVSVKSDCWRPKPRRSRASPDRQRPCAPGWLGRGGEALWWPLPM